MKIIDLRKKNTKNDVSIGSIVDYKGAICLLAEADVTSSKRYTLIDVHTGYVASAYDFLSDIDFDDKVTQLDKDFSCKLVIENRKEEEEGSAF